MVVQLVWIKARDARPEGLCGGGKPKRVNCGERRRRQGVWWWLVGSVAASPGALSKDKAVL